MKRMVFGIAVLAATTLTGCRDEEYTVLTNITEDATHENVRPLVLESEEVVVPGSEERVRLALVKRGTFLMGDNTIGEAEHQVTLTKDYYIGVTEVTQGLYAAVMGDSVSPSQFNYSDQHPVESVSYNEAVEFCQRLSRLTGYRFDLPTEAEWEYAAYGGHLGMHTAYAGSSTIGNVAWYWNNSPDYLVYNSQTHRMDTVRHTEAVAQRMANALGTYDMTGNVREWCADCWSELTSEPATDPLCGEGSGLRVYRGGGCNDSARYCRVAYREAITPVSRGFSIGFRLVVRQ